METASILVCEDERLVAKDIENSLLRNGYSVAGTASNSDEAIRIAREKAPDLALMDIRLKGSLNGVEIAGILAEEFGIPSIYLTAHADSETLEQAKGTLPLSYLLKPFDEDELKVAVETGLHRHREQHRLITALQSYIEEHCDPEVVDRAVELEREFMKAEGVNSQLRVAGNIGERLAEALELFSEQVEQVANDTRVPEEQRNALRGALIHQDRACRMVHQLLKCGRLSSLKLGDVSVNSVVEQAIRETSRIVGKKLNFVERFSDDKLTARIDRHRIVEALVEVFLNGFEAMKDEPVISVSTNMVYEDFPERFNTKAKPGAFAVIRIGDFGKGMMERDLSRAFEPGFSASNSPLSTGLGLSFVYAVMQGHLGWVDLKSSIESGTEVSLYLPCVEKKKAVENSSK